jgi:hypothetical protein
MKFITTYFFLFHPPFDLLRITLLTSHPKSHKSWSRGSNFIIKCSLDSSHDAHQFNSRPKEPYLHLLFEVECLRVRRWIEAKHGTLKMTQNEYIQRSSNEGFVEYRSYKSYIL